MISSLSLKLLGLSIKMGGYLFTVPLEFNTTTLKVTKTSSQWYWELWKIYANGIFITTLLILLRLMWLIHSKDSNFIILLMHLAAIGVVFILSVFQFTFMIKFSELQAFTNHYIGHSQRFQDHYGKSAIWRWKGKSETIMKICIGICFVHPVLSELFICFYFTEPSRMKYLTFMFIFWEPLPELVYVVSIPIVVVFFQIWIITILSLFLAITFLEMMLFQMEEIRPKKWSKWTNNYLRNPGHVTYTYRCLEILTIEVNSVIRDYVHPSLQVILLTLNVTANTVLIRHYDTLGFAGLLVFSVFGGVVFIYQVFFYIALGKIYENSNKLVKAWKRQLVELPKSSRIRMSKYLKSFRALKIEIGSFGFYQKRSSLQAIGRVLYYTGKVLLTTKRYL